MRDNFCVFILTHGRADDVTTLKTLERQGYTGKWYIVIDNEDEQAERYYDNFGDHVLMFDKAGVAKTFDQGDLSDDRRSVVFARNACFEFAKQVGARYFLELDDDYTDFQYRYIDNQVLRVISLTRLDGFFEAMLTFLDESGALTVTFAQGGDFIGGADSGNLEKGLSRKAMNTFFCDVEKPFQFVGRINEDVNTYTRLGSSGELLFTYTGCMITQKPTQNNAGGMTDIYKDNGTFLKSFFSVMYMPSCVRVASMGDHFQRMHHEVRWNNCVPKILSDKWRKA